jgi:two-component system response regulator RegA
VTQRPVLLIDDDETFGRVLARALVRHGYRVDRALDPASAMALMREHRYRYVLLDMMLGEKSALHLIAPLRRVCPDVRIVILTGYASIPTTVKALRLGAANYLAKPVGAREVAAALRDDLQVREEPRPISLKRLEWEHIQRVLTEHDGNVSAAARRLNMHRRSLQRKLRKHAPSD